MNIGINGYEAVVPRFGYDAKTGLPNRAGSGEYCYQLINKLYQTDNTNNYVIYLPVAPAADMPKARVNWNYKIVKSKVLWTLLGLSRYFLGNPDKLDVFFSPTHYLPLYVPCKSVISLMDLSYLYFPGAFKKKDLYQLKLWTKMSVIKAHKIITISEASRSDIIKYYKTKQDMVKVVYPGIK